MKNLEQMVNKLVKLLQELPPSTRVVVCNLNDTCDGCVIEDVKRVRELVGNDETVVIIE